MIEPYNEDYFYFNSSNEQNWWDNQIFKEESFLKFKDQVHWYFDNELCLDKVLVDFICDDNGNDLEYNGDPVVKRLDLLICFRHQKGDNISNTAFCIKEWLVKNNFME